MIQCLFTTDFAPRRRMAGFALGMAVSLAVYLQLIASLSKAFTRAHSADVWTAVCSTQVAGRSSVPTRGLHSAAPAMPREGWITSLRG